MTFARWVYRIAGIYGLVVIGPLYFLEAQIGRDQPAPITHPEYFYGFAGVTLAWQVAFLIIGQDPVRYRWLMIPAIPVIVAVMAFNFLGDGLRDAADPYGR